MLESVSFLADMNLCHTDLKPENVLCAHPEYSKVQLMGKDRFGRRVPRSSKIKVIDFGSATFEDQYHSKIISTRHYRAPEVILGIKWSYGCDVWSLGCIFAEILTGEALYQTHENLEHLAMIERTCGRFPTWMVRAAEDQSWFDREKGLVRWGGSSRSHRAVMRLSRVHSMIRAVNEGSSTEPRALEAFADLVGKMLAIDPKVTGAAVRGTTRVLLCTVDK